MKIKVADAKAHLQKIVDKYDKALAAAKAQHTANEAARLVEWHAKFDTAWKDTAVKIADAIKKGEPITGDLFPTNRDRWGNPTHAIWAPKPFCYGEYDRTGMNQDPADARAMLTLLELTSDTEIDTKQVSLRSLENIFRYFPV